MTRAEAITELVRIWHSPHLDLSLRAGLAEAIDALKESNLNDSLVRDDAENCKESERKLDLIRRSDAIEAVRTAKAIFDTTLEPYIKPQDAVDALSALPSAEAVEGWIPCSERLPSKAEHRNDMVLVCYGNGSIRFNTYMNGWVQGFPIAWMPLPEPYKGGDDSE